MKYPCIKIFLVVIISITPLFAFSQPNSNYYKNFVLSSNKIYALYGDSIIKSFNQDNGRLLQTIKWTVKITSLTQDHLHNVIISDEKNIVSRLNKVNNTWTTVAKYNGDQIYAVSFNSTNTCFLITDKGILNTSTRNTYYPEHKFFHSEWNHGNGNGWSTDDVVKTYMDKDDNLWFMFQHGEWGNDLLIFNTPNNNFCDYTKETAMPFFGYNNYIYGSTSSLLGLCVIQYDKKVGSDGKFIYNGEIVYNEENDPSIPHIQGHTNNFDASAFTYNNFNGKLYIVSSSGLRMANPLTPVSQFSDWKPVQKLHLPHRMVTTISEYFSNKKMLTR